MADSHAPQLDEVDDPHQIALSINYEHGAVGKALSNARVDRLRTPVSLQLLERLRCQLRAISAEFVSRQREGHSPRTCFVTAVRGGFDFERIHGLLQFILATEAGLPKCAASLQDKAYQDYVRWPQIFDEIFSGLVPDRFRVEFAAQQVSDGLDDFLPFESIVAPPGSNTASTRIPTGIVSLDVAIPSWDGLTFIGGDRGVGKTALMLFLAKAALENDPELSVVFFSLDMARERLQKRLLCMEAGVPYRSLLTQDESIRCLLRSADATLRKNIFPRLKIVERNFQPTGLGLDNVRQIQRDHQRTCGSKRSLHLFDLFQRMDVPADTRPDDRDDYRLDLFRCVRRETEAPIIASSEIRKQPHPDRELTHDDLLGSSRIASDADLILLLSMAHDRKNRADSEQQVKLRIDKGRDGVQRVDVQLLFQHEITRFSEAPPSASTNSKRSPASPKARAAVDPLAGT